MCLLHCFLAVYSLYLQTILALAQRQSKTPVIQVHLVETSLALRGIQSERLSGAPAQLQWYDSIDHIMPSNNSFTMLVAHEFFDALPVHVLRVSGQIF